jgi:putative membrane protein
MSAATRWRQRPAAQELRNHELTKQDISRREVLENSKGEAAMMGFGLIFTVAVIAAVAYALGWRPPSNATKPDQNSRTPLEQLKARYARGEISREEFEQMRADLER